MMTEQEFIQQYTDNMLEQKLSLEREGVSAFDDYFKKLLLFVSEQILEGNLTIEPNESIVETLQSHATLCVERTYHGQNLTIADQSQLASLLANTLNRRINDVATSIDAYTERQIRTAIKRAIDALEEPYTAKQVETLVMAHLRPIWERRAQGMVISETQANTETIQYESNRFAEEQATLNILLEDDERLEEHLRASTVFSYLVLADELEQTPTDKRLTTVLGRTKRWITMADELVRPSHAAVHGQTADKNGFFIVGGSAMRYPGDPMGPPQEVINCRCVLVNI